jgi:hypothetical protein
MTALAYAIRTGAAMLSIIQLLIVIYGNYLKVSEVQVYQMVKYLDGV